MKFDNVIKANTKEHNPSLPPIPDYPYRTLIIRGSGSGITNSLFTIITITSLKYW